MAIRRGELTRVLQPVRYRKPGGVPAVATRWSIGAERDGYPETEWLLDPEGCRFVLVGRKSSEDPWLEIDYFIP